VVRGFLVCPGIAHFAGKYWSTRKKDSDRDDAYTPLPV
jgi:hypothetical protein